MSGGVGATCNDISLPKQREATPRNPSSFFSFRQLNVVAVVVVLAASGMVNPADMAFVVFVVLYMYFLSRFAFPKLADSEEPPVFDPGNKILPVYVSVGAVVGLLLPILYIFEGVIEGDKEGIRAASPHVFLLASQVFAEGIAFSGRFSTPIRVFVPVCFNSMRIFAIVEWLTSEFSKGGAEFGGSSRRLYTGRALAVANMGFWSFNLLGFLLPVYLPKAFKRYYSAFKEAKD